MAIWQYDFYLVPNRDLINQIGTIPSRLSNDQFNELKYWVSQQPAEGFQERFGRWRKQFPSWTRDLSWWGSEESDRIDVWQKDGLVTEIRFRIELRRLDVGFIQLMVDVARDCECSLFSAHTLELIDPVRSLALTHLINHAGVNEVWEWLRDPAYAGKVRHASRIFLSHSSPDKPFVDRLAIDLRNQNIPVWYDKWELKVGDSLTEKISHGIQQSGLLAVVLSKNSVASSWVQRELNTALALELQKKEVFVLPVLIDDCEVPAFLLDKLYADFRHSYQQGFDAILARVLRNPV